VKSWPAIDIPEIPFKVSSVSLFDAMSEKIVPLELNDTSNYLYVCGITPYDSTHIGHATTYVFFDVLHRLLKLTTKPVVMIENVTDIDEPLFKKANEVNIDWQELAESQVERFRKDMTLLRVIPPDHFIAVSEALDAVIQDIAQLLEFNEAYLLDGDIYFKYSGSSYSAQDVEIFAERGGDPERHGKLHPLDSLLWRQTTDEPHFPSPWGEGRPGWHIECVSIIHSIAEKPLLIQAGGSDLLFPHHTMSNQQFSALARQKHLAEAYFHVAMVTFENQKMSKSLGNLVFVDQLIEQGISPMVIRLAILMQNYRESWEFSFDILKEAQVRYDRLVAALSVEMTASAEDMLAHFISALSNDLDTSSALDLLDSWIKETLQNSGTFQHAGVVARTLDATLGLGV
jgi:L-cysteine:1D-myo-inositol 2-amino-2-deoxy-alpha-D-glucopyranoside ligase